MNSRQTMSSRQFQAAAADGRPPLPAEDCLQLPTEDH